MVFQPKNPWKKPIWLLKWPVRQWSGRPVLTNGKRRKFALEVFLRIRKRFGKRNGRVPVPLCLSSEEDRRASAHSKYPIALYPQVFWSVISRSRNQSPSNENHLYCLDTFLPYIRRVVAEGSSSQSFSLRKWRWGLGKSSGGQDLSGTAEAYKIMTLSQKVNF